jgi:hypothetical protein
MKISNRIFKLAIALPVMTAVLFSWALWPPVQGATSASSQLKIPIIPITITIGRASKGCRSFGFCKITIGKLQASASARTVNAELSSAADGKLEVRLLDKAPEEGQTLFIDQDIPLSSEIATKLGVKNATIQRGEYAFSASRSRLNARLAK